MTPREKEVLALIKKFMNNSEIAEELEISVNTVKIHVKKVLKAHGCVDRVDLFKKLKK